MTDGEGLLAAVVAAPDDDTPRLVFADWLDEQDATQVCPECGGRCGEDKYPADDPTNRLMHGSHWYPCSRCSGRGYVPSSAAARAEFIRLQVKAARLPKYVGECKVCHATPDEDGWINHGKGCYTQSEDGGGSEGADENPELIDIGKRLNVLSAQYVRDCGPWSREFIRGVLGPNWLQRSAAWQWWWSRGFIEHVELPYADWRKYADDIRDTQPIRRVTLTNLPNGHTLLSDRELNTLLHNEWPDIQFDRPERAYP